MSTGTISPATESVRRRMQRTRSDNAFEKAVRSRLHRLHLRYRVHFPIPGLKRHTCDLAFPKLKIAVFLDGCFFHGCPIHPPSVRKNSDFWLTKIDRNRARDKRVNEALAAAGWKALRFWEHETVDDIVETIASIVLQARSSVSGVSVSGTLEYV